MYVCMIKYGHFFYSIHVSAIVNYMKNVLFLMIIINQICLRDYLLLPGGRNDIGKFLFFIFYQPEAVREYVFECFYPPTSKPKCPLTAAVCSLFTEFKISNFSCSGFIKAFDYARRYETNLIILKITLVLFIGFGCRVNRPYMLFRIGIQEPDVYLPD